MAITGFQFLLDHLPSPSSHKRNLEKYIHFNLYDPLPDSQSPHPNNLPLFPFWTTLLSQYYVSLSLWVFDNQMQDP